MRNDVADADPERTSRAWRNPTRRSQIGSRRYGSAVSYEETQRPFSLARDERSSPEEDAPFAAHAATCAPSRDAIERTRDFLTCLEGLVPASGPSRTPDPS